MSSATAFTRHIASDISLEQHDDLETKVKRAAAALNGYIKMIREIQK